MNRELLEQQLAELPLYGYFFIDPAQLEFSERIRTICRQECPMIATITEVADIADLDETLAARPAHEEITNRVGALMEAQGVKPYILSTEACAICDRCAILDGLPCRHPDKMHPCVESHGINVIPVLEQCGMEFQYGQNVVTWMSLLFY